MKILYVDYSNLPVEIIDHLEVNTTISEVLRKFGYLILKALAYLIDYIYEAINTILNFNLYTVISELTEFKSTVSDLVWVLFGLAVAVMAVFLMVNPDKLKLTDSMRSILVSSLLIISFPTLVSSLESLKTAGVNDMNNQLTSSNLTVGQAILADVIIDIDKSQGAIKTLVDTGKDPYLININELLDNEEWGYKLVARNAPRVVRVSDREINEEYLGLSDIAYYGLSGNTFGHIFLSAFDKNNLKSKFPEKADDIEKADTLSDIYIVLSQEINAWVEERISNTPISEVSANYKKYELKTKYTESGIQGWFEPILTPIENLYSYSMDFIFGIILLVIVLISLILAGIKISKMVFELVLMQVISPLIFATDIQGAGRGKKAIQSLMSTYLIFILTLLNLKVFLLIMGWMLRQTNIAIGVKVLLSLGGGMFIISGSDMVTKILGMDTGNGSALSMMYGANMAAGMVARGGKAAVGILKSPFKLASAPKKMWNSHQDKAMGNQERKDKWSAYKERKKDNKGVTHSPLADDSKSDKASAPNSNGGTNNSSNSNDSKSDKASAPQKEQ